MSDWILRLERKFPVAHAGIYRKSLDLAFSYLSKVPLYCSWQVTYRCNFRCSFCGYWKMNTRKEEELSASDFALGARKLKKIGPMFVSLAGGEPLIRKDLPEIVNAVSSYHFPFITSNGWLVTPEKAKRLFGAGLMGAVVSLDFADEKKHDENRGKEGAFKRAVAAVKYFVDARKNKLQKINITAVLLKENIDEIEKLIIFAKKMGAEFTLQPYANIKSEFGSYGTNGLEDAETSDHTVTQEVSDHLLKLKRKYPNFKSSLEYLRRFDDFFYEGIDNCQAGRLFFNIDQKGDIAKCVEDLKNPVGNIRTIGIEELKNALLRKQRENRCKDCWYGCRGEVECFYTWNGAKNTLARILSGNGHRNGSDF
ncbi:MAG: radical SAM protein [candidate division Zixibacteria bacterium]|nr:radical SAM protein [candidate division Zixibacteria bacterium]